MPTPRDDPERASEVVSHVTRTRVLRVNTLGHLDELDAPLVLLSGPSGAGKSDLLGQWQQSDGDGVFPAPKSLDWSAGVLQRGVIDQLSAVAAVLAADQPAAQRVGIHLLDAARRLATSASADLAKVVGKEILALVKAKVGPGVGDALGEYIANLRASYDERLEQRLVVASDPGVVEALVGFLGEVVALADGREITISLDNVDRLGESDAGALLTLVDALPTGVQIRGAFATDRGGHRLLARLRSGGAVEYPVPPFDLHEIESLLTQAGLSPALALDVQRATSGLPIHAHDLVEHLRRGGGLSDAPRSRQFGERTREAWATLEPAIAAVARRLAVYPAPMGARETALLLGMELHAWSEARDHLLRSGVFSATPGGDVWFHEQRRQFVWEHILNSDERRTSASDAMRSLAEELERSGRLEILPTLAQVAAQLPEDGAEARVRAVTELGRDEVAVLAALMELGERPPGDPAVLGDTLLQYARNTFSGTGDLIASLERLVEAELVYVASNERAVAVVSRLSDGLAGPVLAGRASNELGRLPIPSAASAFFNLELRPRLGNFDRAAFGVGRVSLVHLGTSVKQLQRMRSDRLLHFGPPAPALLVRAMYQSVDTYAAVTFNSDTDRAVAAELLAALDREGGRTHIVDIVEHPCPPVPSQRFLQAAALLTGVSNPRMHASSLSTPVGLAEGVALRHRAEGLLRALCTPLELMAFGLDQPCSYIVVPEPEGRPGGFIVQVLGRSEPVETRDQLPNSPFAPDPYAHFRLARELGLRTGESLGLLEYRSGGFSQDPVLDLLEKGEKSAQEFNRTVDPRQVSLDEAELASLVRDAWARRWRDAVALAEVIEPAQDQTPLPEELEVTVHVGRKAPAALRLSSVLISYRRRPSSGSAPVASVRVVEQPADVEFDDWYRESTVDLYDLRSPWTQSGDGIASSVLADLLGYELQELRLIPNGHAPAGGEQS
jgi:hypothetical protein